MSSLIAVTGANGYLGFHIVKQLLAAGHSTRAIVRSQSSAKRLQEVFSDAVAKSALTFAFVPDIVANEHVYDDAFAGATAVIHTASPIFSLTQKSTDPDADFYIPAINGALNAVKAAARSSTVGRFVLTSSVVARYPTDRTYGPTYPRNEVTPVSRERARTLTEPQHMYRASKALSEQAVWDWVRDHKPASLSVTALLPALFAGPFVDAEADQGVGSNSIYVAWAKTPKVLLGKSATTATDVLDVARAHVNAALLPDDVVANQSFFVVQRTVRAVEVIQAAQQSVPQWSAGWDDETRALVERVANEQPDEEARGIIAVSQEEDARTLGIAPLTDIVDVLKTLFPVVDAQGR